MKLSSINPTKLFKSKKPSKNSLSRNSETEISSFSSHTTSSSEQQQTGTSTPTTVLPPATDNVYYYLKQAFDMIDKDKSGKVEKKELGMILNRIGTEPITGEELESMLDEVDRDGDGCISLEEFSDAIGDAFVVPPSCDSELKEVFEIFDTDRDGKITAEELFGVFEMIGGEICTLEECKRMITGVDANGDGFVCFEDFTRMMTVHQL